MAKAPAPAPAPLKGVLSSTTAGPWTAREAWSVEGTADARRLSASGEFNGEEPRAWRLAAAFGPAGAVESFDLQVHPTGRPSEVTTTAFRCFGGVAFGTTIGPGGLPEKTRTAFPPGSAFRGFSFALDALTASATPLRLGHGRRLVVIECDAADLVPRVRDWMVLAVSKDRAGEGSGAGWAYLYEFRPADSPGRAETTVQVAADSGVLRASRAFRGGTVEVRPE
jgi:hypothetical protein